MDSAQAGKINACRNANPFPTSIAVCAKRPEETLFDKAASSILRTKSMDRRNSSSKILRPATNAIMKSGRREQIRQRAYVDAGAFSFPLADATSTTCSSA